MTFSETLEQQLAESAAWRKANIDKIGTPEYRKRVLVEPILRDLAKSSGGNEAQRAEAARTLAMIEAGTHPDSVIANKGT